MSVSGDIFEAGVPISAAKLNKKTITFSSNISTEPAIPGQVFFSTANVEPYRKNDLVARNIDDDGYTVISQSRHKHNTDTNQAGGKLVDILKYNIGQSIYLNKNVNFSTALDYHYGSTGTTYAIDSATGAMKMDTSTTANNYHVGRVCGVSPSLAYPITLQTMMQYHGNTTNQFARWGLNLESMDIANNNTVKFGIESCAGTNNNWNIITADGTNRTTIDANASLDGAASVPSKHGFVLEYIPGSYVNFYFDTATLVVSKSTNLPPTSSPDDTIPNNNIINYGIKTTDTNSKQLYIWGLAMVADVKDSAWKQRI